MPRKPPVEVLARAKQDGFDVAKLWFHGTRRRFDGFQLPKERGIDELGPGVYLTSVKWLANTWARERGFIVICVVRDGPLFDLETIKSPANIAMMRQVYIRLSLESWFGDKPKDVERRCGEYFDENFKRNSYATGNRCLSAAGYVGGFKRASQISGQIVVFKPEDVLIVAREGGKAYMTD